MDKTIEKNITDEASAAQTVAANYTWYLNACQLHGNLWLSWRTTAPFRAQQGQIMVYSGQFFPTNPQDNVRSWQWDNVNSSGWDTGLPWGSDWYYAWTAQRSPNGPSTYAVQLITK